MVLLARCACAYSHSFLSWFGQDVDNRLWSSLIAMQTIIRLCRPPSAPVASFLASRYAVGEPLCAAQSYQMYSAPAQNYHAYGASAAPSVSGVTQLLTLDVLTIGDLGSPPSL